MLTIVASKKTIPQTLVLALAACVTCMVGCGRFFLSEEVARSPSVSSASMGLEGSSRRPIATVWVEQVSVDEIAVVGKVFDSASSQDADAATVRVLSTPIPVVLPPLCEPGGFCEISDPTDEIAGVTVTRMETVSGRNDGFFVAWIEKNGPLKGLFTDLDLVPTGPPIEIVPFLGAPARAQGRHKMWSYYVPYNNRLVVFWDAKEEVVGGTPKISYAIFDRADRALLRVSKLSPVALWADISFSSNPNRRPPFMLAYASPTGDLEDPIEVRAAMIDFNSPATDLLTQCTAIVLGAGSPGANQIAHVTGAFHPFGTRVVVHDERDGIVYGNVVTDDCDVRLETVLGRRLVVSSSGQFLTRNALPMDLQFNPSGDGLLALKQGIPNDNLPGGRAFIVSVMPIDYDAGFVFGEPLNPVGVVERSGNPYSNRSFELGWNQLDGVFELVFDEVQLDSRGFDMPTTWGVLYNALDSDGSTVDP